MWVATNACHPETKFSCDDLIPIYHTFSPRIKEEKNNDIKVCTGDTVICELFDTNAWHPEDKFSYFETYKELLLPLK